MASIDWDLLSSYAGLLTLASGSIYVGSFGSVKRDRSAREEIDIDDIDVDERVSSKDAWLFPAIGSVTLLGLYTIVKYFGKEWINWVLGWYFSLTGVGSVWKSLISLTRFVLGDTRWKQFDTSKLLVTKGHSAVVYLSWKTPSLFLLPLGALPSILYNFSSGSRRSILLTDILSLSFSHNALSLIKIDTFKTGCILLSGLFFYDIWWVFGTEVMIKVATTLDIPIKLLWPKSLVFSDANGFAMLGLGDVVIPGIFISLALRYDHYHFCHSSPQRPFTKPYFYTALSAYIVGLVITMAVLHVFKNAQPALLYLSPACMLAFFVTALIRGELKEAWNWTDGPTAQQAAGEGDEKPTSQNGAITADGEPMSEDESVMSE